MQRQRITILGSTGSVGTSTLSVINHNRQRYQVVALTANNNVMEMFAQCQQYHPQEVVMQQAAAAQQLQSLLQEAGLNDIRVDSGEASLIRVAEDASSDSVMAAIVGAAGLKPTLAAVRAGKRVLIANKEPLVMTGPLFMQEAAQSRAQVLPIDSEHNAIFQCLPANQDMLGVKRLHLTASGGPFRGRVWQDLNSISPAQACAHPNWEMGRKISVDSATMMNKGLELIEAAALFGLNSDRVDILIHPQSIIHSMVEYVDGSFLAQLGAPDMCIPIAHALSWPERIESGADTLNLAQIARLEFEQPDMDNLPCLRLAREAARTGGSAPAVLNAANEVAVDAFLQGKIRFTQIPELIDATLNALPFISKPDLETVLQIDNDARQHALSQLD